MDTPETAAELDTLDVDVVFDPLLSPVRRRVYLIGDNIAVAMSYTVAVGDAPLRRSGVPRVGVVSTEVACTPADAVAVGDTVDDSLTTEDAVVAIVDHTAGTVWIDDAVTTSETAVTPRSVAGIVGDDVVVTELFVVEEAAEYTVGDDWATVASVPVALNVDAVWTPG